MNDSTPFSRVVDSTPCAECGAAEGERCVKVTEGGTRRPIGRNHEARLAAFAAPAAEPAEHRLYTQAEDDAAVIAYLTTPTDEYRLRPRVGGTGADRMTGQELNEYVEEAVTAGRIIEIPGDPYTYALTADVTESAALAVLAHFGHPAGREAGGFVTSLLETMGRADKANRLTLVEAFPRWGQPFLLAHSVVGGTAALAKSIGR